MTTNTPASSPSPAPIPTQIANTETIAATPLPSTYHLDAIAPRQTGDLNLTDAEQALLRDAAKNGSLRDAWAKIHSAREQAATAHNAELLAKEAAQAAQQPAQDDPFSDAALLERTGGTISRAIVEAAISAGELTSSRLEHIAQTHGKEAFDAAVARGHQDVLERNFRGDRGAWERAINEIDAATRVIDPSGALLEALVSSGVLSDGAIFTRLQGMARSVLAKVGRS
jgi:hypothetical protein